MWFNGLFTKPTQDGWVNGHDLWGHLRKFEKLLSTVNDSDRTIRVSNTNIARTEPPLYIKGICCNLFTVEISTKDVGTFHLNFSTRKWFVSREVIHFRDIL